MPSLHPNNPFVSNEWYFLNSTQAYVYQDTWIHFARLINTLAFFSTGFLLSSFVFYLIATKSPIHFRLYRKMLVLATVVDVYAILQFTLAQSRYRNIDAAALLTFTGPLTVFEFKAYCPILALQNTASSIGICVLPVQYYYRYYTVTRNQSPSISQTIFWFLLSMTLFLLSILNNMSGFCLQDDPNPDSIDYGPLWFSELPIPPLLVWSVNKGFSLSQITGSTLLILYYLTSLWFARKTVRVLDERFSSITINSSVKKVNKQLSKTLFAQSLVPLLTNIVPRIIPVFMTYLYINSDHIGEYITMVSVWYPIFNLLSTIIFIEPYWKFCMGYCPLSKHYKWKSNVSGFQSSQQTVAGRVALTVVNN